MSFKATKEELRRSQLKRSIKWHNPEQRPDYAKDAPEISVTVLLYFPDNDIHSLGWFNFDQDKWGNLYDGICNIDDSFVWCYPPKPNSQSK